jgi:hypothetical protein
LNGNLKGVLVEIDGVVVGDLGARDVAGNGVVRRLRDADCRDEEDAVEQEASS